LTRSVYSDAKVNQAIVTDPRIEEPLSVYRSGPAIEGALRGILEICGIRPDKLLVLSDGLRQANRWYSTLKIMRQITPPAKLAKLFGEISAAASMLTRAFDENSPSSAEVGILLSLLGLKTKIDEVIRLLTEIDRAACQAYEMVRAGISEDEYENNSDNLGLDALIEREGLDPITSSLVASVVGAVIAGSVMGRRGNSEKPTTYLFYELRNLYVKLGGTTAVGSRRLYNFVAECVKLIDRKISMPEPEPFRILMIAALKRRGGGGGPALSTQICCSIAY
jgi:hypothetical protein